MYQNIVKKIRPSIIILSLILIIGAFFRLYRIADYLTFLGDEGRDVLVVRRMLVDHKFTLLGPTASVGGFFLGPIYYYFMAPFLWAFNYNPVGPAVMVALFGVVTIFLLYKVGRKFFGETAGLCAAFIYAVSPVVVAYSRSSWNPNLVPFFSLLSIYLAYKIAAENRWRLMFWLGLLFGINLQLHYLVTFLAAAVIIYLLSYGRLKKLKEYGLAIVGGIAGLSPFLLFEIRHGFPNLISLFNFIFHGREVGVGKGGYFSIVGDVLFRLFDHLVLNKISENTFRAFGISFGKMPFVSLIVLLCSLLAFGLLFYKKRSDKKAAAAIYLVFLWGLAGVLLFGLYKKGIYDYYFGFLFAWPFLLFGNLMGFLSKRPWGKIIMALSLLFIFFLNWEGRPFRYEPNRQLLQAETISRFVLGKAGGRPFNFALITGANSDHAYRYFFEVLGNKPVTIENAQVDPQRKTVTSQLLIVCEKIDCAPLGNSLWEVAGFGRAEIAGKWDVSVVKVYRLVPYRGK